MPPTTNPINWVQYDLTGVLARLASVSWEAELAHRRLADYHWATGLWVPARGPLAWTTARVPARRWPAILRELHTLGWRITRGALVHHQVRRVRAKAVAACRQVRAAGRKGGLRRWASLNAMPATPKPGGPLPSDPISDPIGDPIGGPIGDPNTDKDKDEDKDEIRDREKISLAFNAERLTLSASPLKKESEPEQQFLAEVLESIAAWSPKEGSQELVNWGGWWRNRFREDADKARRILAELRVMIREHRITTSPGAAAGDLWKRLP